MTNTFAILKKARKIKNDEFYTSYNTVKLMLDEHIEYIKKTFNRVVLPFDTNESQFVKYMQDHNVNYINYDKIAINEIHTIIQPGDIIISNPPFSKCKALIEEIDKYNIKFMVIFAHLFPIYSFFMRSKMFKDVNWSANNRIRDWTNINKVVGISFCNNIGIKYYKDEIFFNKDIEQRDDDFHSTAVFNHTNKKNYHLFYITTQDDKRLFLKTMFFDELNQDVLDKIKDIAAKNNYKIINIRDLKVTYYYDKSCHELRQV